MLNQIKKIAINLSPIDENQLKRKILQSSLNSDPLVTNYIYDADRFSKWSSGGSKKHTKVKLEALITIQYHRIEKGLAFAQPKVGFGKDAVQKLLSHLEEYRANYQWDDTAQTALNVLFEYYHFHLEKGIQNENLYQQLVSFQEIIDNPNAIKDRGGTHNISRQNILDAGKIDLRAFFENRYSIRNFTNEEVDIALIKAAVKMAQKTPSVCNRQSSQVYVFSQEQDKKKVLSYQNGNRGFGHQANKVLIVTSNLEHFVWTGERNQCWIDGGMFSMSLVYALHSLGLGTCCLNWCVTQEKDRELRTVAGISDSDAIIMMIAVGHIPEKLKVAQSQRKNIDDILIIK